MEQTLGQQGGKEVAGLRADQWHDEGPWLLLPLISLAALFFRRGYLFVLALVLLPQMRPAQAADWSSLWQNDDQRAQQAMAAQQPQAAAKLFQDPQWRSVANYRAGNYQAALDSLKGIDSAEADYNRGNALAKLGRLPEAMAAYEQALKRDPKMEDARFNRDLLEKMKQQQDQQKQGDKQQDNKQQDSKEPQKESKDGKQSQKPDDKSKPEKDNAQQKSGQDGKKPENGKQQPDQSNQPNGKSQQDKSRDGSASAAKKEQQDQQQGANRSAAAEQDQAAKQLQKADEQWLRRIPDDPGGLWRRKFLEQYKKQQQGSAQ
jgi:Ca-activated chloride channel family protein